MIEGIEYESRICTQIMYSVAFSILFAFDLWWLKRNKDSHMCNGTSLVLFSKLMIREVTRREEGEGGWWMATSRSKPQNLILDVGKHNCQQTQAE